MWKIINCTRHCMRHQPIRELAANAKHILSSVRNRNLILTTQNRNKNRMAAADSLIKPQQYDYFLVLDFEATCENNQQIVPQEIIEFPVLKVNAVTLKTEASFHEYVQPRVHPKLTSFCTELTGIIQDMVDNQPYVEEVLQKFDAWMSENGLLSDGVSSIFVTCGDWDLKKMLPGQCQHFNIPSKPYFKSWINIKKSFAEATGHFPKGIMPMLQQLQLKHEGRLHSGIDDCRNISQILCELVRKGYVFRQNGFR